MARKARSTPTAESKLETTTDTNTDTHPDPTTPPEQPPTKPTRRATKPKRKPTPKPTPTQLTPLELATKFNDFFRDKTPDAAPCAALSEWLSKANLEDLQADDSPPHASNPLMTALVLYLNRWWTYVMPNCHVLVNSAPTTQHVFSADSFVFAHECYRIEQHHQLGIDGIELADLWLRHPLRAMTWTPCEPQSDYRSRRFY